MSDKELCRALAAVGKEVGLRILYGRPRGRGGSCSYHGRGYVVIHSDSDFAQRASVLAQSLAEREVDETLLESQEVRSALDRARAALVAS